MLEVICICINSTSIPNNPLQCPNMSMNVWLYLYQPLSQYKLPFRIQRFGGEYRSRTDDLLRARQAL